MKSLFRYIRLWTKLTVNSFLVSLTTRLSVLLFLLGKMLRFVLFFIFLLTLFSRTNRLADYSSSQVIFFFLTFNLIDTLAQLFFREVYRFRPMVVSGDFDLVLIKPINPLFRALAGGADPLDLVMLVPYIGGLVYVGGLAGGVTLGQFLYYVLLLANGLLIATGFHILVLALAIVTTEIDHAIMIYRDITSMGRIPVDIYREPLRSFLLFVIPVGVMVTVPARAFLGLLSPIAGLGACVIGVVFFSLCLGIWRYALRQYSSASS